VKTFFSKISSSNSLLLSLFSILSLRRLILAIFLLLSLLSFWPGMGSYDSLWSLNVALGTQPINPGLSYAYLLLIKISLVVFGNTGLVIIFQMFALVYSVSALINSLFVNKIVSAVLQLFIFISPPFLLITFGIWKDGLFISGYILLISLLINYINDSKVVTSKFNLKLFVGLFLVLAFRPNGFIVILTLLLATLIFVIFSSFKVTESIFIYKVIFLSLLFSILFFLINFILPTKLQHETWHMKANTYQQFYHDIIKIWQVNDSIFTTDEINYLNSFGNKELIVSENQCEMANTLYGVADFGPFLRDSNTLMSIWLKSFFNDPGRIIETRVCRASNILKPFPRTKLDDNGFASIPFPFFAGQWSEGEIGPNYLIQKLTFSAQKYIQVSWNPVFIKLIWWAGLYIWLSILAYLIYAVNANLAETRKNKGINFLMLTNLFHISSTSLFVPATDFRFGVIPQLLSILIIAHIILPKRFKHTL
jgi:hypothetical protein